MALPPALPGSQPGALSTEAVPQSVAASSLSVVTVTQDGAAAGGHVVGGNLQVGDTHNYFAGGRALSVVEQLMHRLAKEIEDNIRVKETIEALRRFYNKRSVDGVDGLEAKLKEGGREHETLDALEKKEMFVKTLERWSLYASAQQIFVYLLARAEHEFSTHIYPQIGSAPEYEINKFVTERIVEPVVMECGATVFEMNHGVALGMVYWLAEQCFVRWHR